MVEIFTSYLSVRKFTNIAIEMTPETFSHNQTKLVPSSVNRKWEPTHSGANRHQLILHKENQETRIEMTKRGEIFTGDINYSNEQSIQNLLALIPETETVTLIAKRWKRALYSICD